MGPTGISRYKSVQVNTASPGELLLMLYDGLFRFINEAIVSLHEKNRARTGERIDRAHAILGELVSGLDSRYAPELCENLEALYLFCMGRLVDANLQQNPVALEEVLRVLTPLRDGWHIVIRGEGAPVEVKDEAKDGEAKPADVLQTTPQVTP